MNTSDLLTEVSMEMISADVTQRRYAAATQQGVDRVPQLTRCRLLGVNLLLPELTDGLLLYAWPVVNGSVHSSHAPLNWTLGPTVRGAHEL